MEIGGWRSDVRDQRSEVEVGGQGQRLQVKVRGWRSRLEVKV